MLVCLVATLSACGKKPVPSDNGAGLSAGRANTNQADQPTPIPTETPHQRFERGAVTPTATPTFEFHYRPPTPTSIPIKPALASTQFPQSLEAISPENAGRIVEVARWGKGTVQQTLWSPDGLWLAVAFTSGIVFYDSVTLSQAGWIDISADAYTSLAFSPDGSLLAVGLISGGARFWRVPDGEQVKSFPEISWQPGNSLAFSADAGRLVSSTFMDVSVWRTNDSSLIYKSSISSPGFTLSPDGALLAAMDQDRLVIHATVDGSLRLSTQLDGQVNAFTYAPDGKTIAVAVEDASSGSQSVQVLNAIDGRMLQNLPFEGKRLVRIAFAPGGAILAAWSKGYETVRFWRIVDWKPVLELQDRQFVFSPDGSLVAAWSFSEPDARVYRIATGLQAYTLPGHEPGVIEVLFTPLGARPEENALATVSGNGNLRLWSAKNGSLIKPLGEIASLPGRSALLPGKATATKTPVLVAQMQDGSLKLFRSNDGGLIKTLEDAPRSIADLAFDPGGKLILYRFNDKGGCQLRVSDGSLQDCFSVSQGKLVSALSPDGSAAFLTSTSDGNETGSPFWIKHTATYSVEIKLTLPFSLTLASFPGDGKALLLASPHGKLIRFHVKDGSQASNQVLALDSLETLPAGETSLEIVKLYVSPDGKTLVSANSDGSLVVWNASDGSPRCRLEYPQSQVPISSIDTLTVAFSTDGSLVAVGAPDTPVGLFRLDDGSLVRRIDVDAGYTRRLAFFPGGQILASGASSHIHLSDLANGLEITQLQTLGWIAGLAVSQDGRLLASVTQDGVIQIWGVLPKR